MALTDSHSQRTKRSPTDPVFREPELETSSPEVPERIAELSMEDSYAGTAREVNDVEGLSSLDDNPVPRLPGEPTPSDDDRYRDTQPDDLV